MSKIYEAILQDCCSGFGEYQYGEVCPTDTEIIAEWIEAASEISGDVAEDETYDGKIHNQNGGRVFAIRNGECTSLHIVWKKEEEETDENKKHYA